MLMPIINYYSANGKLISSKDEPLNEQNLPIYLEEHSAERLKGYADALSDMIKLLGNGIWTDYAPNQQTKYNGEIRRSKIPLIKTFNEQVDFLKYLSERSVSTPNADELNP